MLRVAMMENRILDMEVDPERLRDDSLPRLSVYGASEFLDHPAPDARWLVPGLVPLGVPAVLASKGGVGKSWLCLQMSIALATGKPFLSFEAQEPMGAVYFGLEDSKDTFHRRFRSIVDHYKACNDWTDEDDQALRKNFAAPYINWKAEGASSYLPVLVPNLELVLETNLSRGVKPGLIVIDTLARVSEGDENTVAALRPVLNACNALTDYGWTPIMLHHVGKGQDGSRVPGQKKPALSDRMSTDWVRGSSAIVDNFRCTLQLAVINEDEADGAGLDTEKARMGGYIVFGATKLNGGMKADWIFLEQDDHGRWFAPQDGLVTLANIRGAKARAALSKQLELLVDLYKARFSPEPDMGKLAEKHYPTSSNPKNALKQAIYKLRNAGLVQKMSYQVTQNGLDKVRHCLKVTDEDNSNE